MLRMGTAMGVNCPSLFDVENLYHCNYIINLQNISQDGGTYPERIPSCCTATLRERLWYGGGDNTFTISSSPDRDKSASLCSESSSGQKRSVILVPTAGLK